MYFLPGLLRQLCVCECVRDRTTIQKTEKVLGAELCSPLPNSYVEVLTPQYLGMGLTVFGDKVFKEVK